MASLANANFCVSEICNVLEPVKHKWSKIGIQLGIPNHKLKEFKKEDDPLTEVVDYWLMGNVEGAILCWQSLVAALKSPQVCEPGLARRVHNDYCQQGKITAEAGGNSSCKAEDNVAELSPDIQEDLIYVLECNKDKICSQYASFVSDIQQSIKKCVSAEDLSYYLSNLPALTSSTSEQCKLLPSEELKTKLTVLEVFEFISTNFADFLHYEIFEKIVDKYGSEGDQELLKQYSDSLTEYVNKHKLSEFVEINPKLNAVSKDSEKISFKIAVNLLPLKLAEVFELKKKFSKILGMRPSALRFYSVEEGCVMLTFLVPVSVAKEIFNRDKKLTEKQIADFQALKVKWIKCGDFSFNFENLTTVAGKSTEIGASGVKMKTDTGATLIKTDTRSADYVADMLVNMHENVIKTRINQAIEQGHYSSRKDVYAFIDNFLKVEDLGSTYETNGIYRIRIKALDPNSKLRTGSGYIITATEVFQKLGTVTTEKDGSISVIIEGNDEKRYGQLSELEDYEI